MRRLFGLRQRFNRLPIFNRLLIGNSAVIVVGAVGGTLLTHYLTDLQFDADFWQIGLFAILGILLANMLLFSGYFFLSSESVAQLGTATADHIAVFLIDVLVDGKFYSLFSFLFGVGFAIQLIYALSLFSCEHQDPIIFGHFQTLESRIEAC